MMEAKLDYLIQYTVDRVHVKKQSHQWMLHFSNEATLTNEQKKLKAPEQVEGLALLTVVYSDKETRVQFGIPKTDGTIERETWVSWDTKGNQPTYTVFDPRLSTEEEGIDTTVEEDTVEGSREQEGPQPGWEEASRVGEPQSLSVDYENDGSA